MSRKRIRQWFGYKTRRRASTLGINDAWDLTTVSVARDNSGNPYLIANEWICSNIGNFLRLPVPPFALMRKSKSKVGMFASLRFGRGDTPPDDFLPDECVKSLPHLSAGVVLFDVLIANNDRHSGNLKVDSPIDPKKLCVFDHDQALFGAMGGDGIARLKKLRDRLGVTGSPLTQGNRHCLLNVLTTASDFADWRNRIAEIPTWFIEEICLEMVKDFITLKEARAAIDFLKHRRNHIDSIVLNARTEFPLIHDWGITL